MTSEHFPRAAAFVRLAVGLVAVGFVAVGCRQDMQDQPRLKPLGGSTFFADGMGARPIPAGTVARGQLNEDTELYAGKDAAGELLDRLPSTLALDRPLLERGRQRFEIYCSPCHDSTGSGRGMIVRRGFKAPPALFEPRLEAMPLGYFFDVMTHGFGVMSPYAKQVSVSDRWAIAAYVRVLQTAQSSRLAELPAPVRQGFEEAMAAAEH